MPMWWLFFIGTFWFPQFVGFTLVPNILLPVQVASQPRKRATVYKAFFWTQVRKRASLLR